ncbi:WxL domain-containing protein [Litchfieldia alkalitelluris]|uniref:WxL domain-containing protein n=1 Tax=Litchfieldia alkalitelluris TaxID=304268 RepID=UPI001472AB99|nr:WxL domain-containing protein [Litchfieldia alkalitelluris]
MNISNNPRIKKLFVFLTLVLLLGIVIVPKVTIASSSEGFASATIKPGPLTLETPRESTKFTLNEEKSIVTGNAGTLVVTDATGSGLGWRVLVTGSPILETKADGSTTILSEGSVRLYKGGAKMTSNGRSFPHFFDSNYLVLVKGKPNTVLTAYNDEGMGQFHISFADDSLRMYLPNYNETSTYSVSITWSITQGP